MALRRASNTLERLGFRKDLLHPTSRTMSEVDKTAANDPPTNLNASVQPQINDQKEATEDKSEELRATDSSPTDPIYIRDGSVLGEELKRPAKPVKASPGTTGKSVSMAGQSFLNFDTDSDDEEPVIGRASSVRMSKASVVEQSSSARGKIGQVYGTKLDDNDRSVSPFGTRHSETSEEMNDKVRDVSQSQHYNSATSTLKSPQRPTTPQNSIEKQTTDDSPFIGTNVSSSDKSERGGLYMHPVAIHDRSGIQRAISAPPLPHTSPLNKKVKIRPSDLIVGHSMGNRQHFRETVVTTPYPNLNGYAEQDEKEMEKDENSSALPQRSGTVKSARFDGDRFPSPDRSEVLFLDIGLARHPAATTTLEIKIADKSGYDDEMLFRQIRTAYRSRLLGLSRLPFFLIRGVTHATVSSSVENDFRTTEFMKHFENPRIGRRRKTWVIWLRLHSRQQSPIRGDHLSIVKRPLSSSIRTADKRLSIQSDTTSTFNFSFLPPLLIPRLPFFSRDTASPSSASTYRSPPAFGSEGGIGTVKVELHHEFSFWILAFLYFWVVFTSIAAVVSWTVFGVPGARPGEGNAETPAAILMNQVAWNAGAQNRVLTGLVLGIMVALLGSMMEICLIAGAYVLL